MQPMKTKGLPKNPARGVRLKNGQKYWLTIMRDGKRRYTNLETSDPGEAISRANELRNNPLASPAPDSDINAVERFFAHKTELGSRRIKGGYSVRSVKAKRNTVTKFARWLPEGVVPLNATSAHVSAWVDHLRLKEGLVESTVAGYMMTLRAFFGWAVAERLRIDNPVKPVAMPKGGYRVREEWADVDQVDRLIRKAPNDDLRFILYCGFHAGLRRTEISEARADWFDLKRGVLYVRVALDARRLRPGEKPFLTKNGSERTIPLTAEFGKFLARYLRKREALDFALRPDVKHGDGDYRYDFRRPFTDFMKAEGKAWITAHVMRHSFTSNLLSLGRPLAVVAKWLGDGQRVTEKHYWHVAPHNEQINVLSVATKA
jgi:site-specific recombinase XerD